MKEELQKAKKEIEELKKQGAAMDILSDYKKQNKRMFILLLVILVMWFTTIGYLVWLLNDISNVVDTNTIDIDNIDQIDNSHIKIGDDTWEK